MARLPRSLTTALAACTLLLAACAGGGPTTSTTVQTADAQAAPAAPVPLMQMGTTAPDVPFLDLDGKRHTLSEFRGKYIILFFYAYFCPICKDDLPKLDAFAKDNAKNGVVIVPIERTGASPDEVRQFIKDSGVQMPLYYDPSKTAANSFQVDHQPWAFLISSDFVVKEDVLGEVPATAYGSRIAKYAPHLE